MSTGQKVHIHEKIKTFNWNSAIEKVHIHEKIKTKLFAQLQKKKQIMFQTNKYVLQAVSLVLLYEQKDTDGLAFKLKAFLMYVVIAERVSYQGTVFGILYSCPTFFIPNRADDKLKCNTSQSVRKKRFSISRHIVRAFVAAEEKLSKGNMFQKSTIYRL